MYRSMYNLQDPSWSSGKLPLSGAVGVNLLDDNKFEVIEFLEFSLVLFGFSNKKQGCSDFLTAT
jgi:hypothetical protein